MNIIVTLALALPLPFVVRCLRRNVVNVHSIGLVVRMWQQFSAGKSKNVTILDQTFHRILVLDLERIDEQIERLLGVLFSRGLLGVVQHSFGLRLNTLWQFIEHVGRFVDRTSLDTCSRKDLLQRLPEAEGALADRQLRRVWPSASLASGRKGQRRAPFPGWLSAEPQDH